MRSGERKKMVLRVYMSVISIFYSIFAFMAIHLHAFRIFGHRVESVESRF